MARHQQYRARNRPRRNHSNIHATGSPASTARNARYRPYRPLRRYSMAHVHGDISEHLPNPSNPIEMSGSDKGGPLSEPSIPESERQPRQPMKIINWRGELCRLLKLEMDAPDEHVLLALPQAETMLDKANKINTVQPQQEELAPASETIYRVYCRDNEPRFYLDEPWTTDHGDNGAHLRGTQHINNFELFLERAKHLSFIVYKDFECCFNEDVEMGPPYDDPTSEIACHFIKESVAIVSEDFSHSLLQLEAEALSDIPSPTFEINHDIRAESNIIYPYLWWFHRREEISQASARLDPADSLHVGLLEDYLTLRLGKVWAAIDSSLANGMISFEYLEYIFVPGTTVISTLKGATLSEIECYVPINWMKKAAVADLEWSSLDQVYESAGSIRCTHWEYDGNFQRSTQLLSVSVPDKKRSFAITNLPVFPIKFASTEIQAALRARGEMFWRCRRQKYVCYIDNANEDISTSADRRFMIDIVVYKQMHPPSNNTPPYRNDLGSSQMSQDNPPLDEAFLLCLPTTIPGFSMQKKEWVNLAVNNIHDVEWNKEAFEMLVADKETKELVRALVENHCNKERNTDLISGKGNGLFILLHGAPGTGKTLTAETVAEIAEKPLYRVTCGDIGTKAEDVEKYLETVLLIGKTWECVVLLDEADVFLEERSLFNLERNALVSIFLRVLEYYDGILILTSNRVAIFDEAFISRMQLTLRYKNLEEPQRKIIWTNSIANLEKHQRTSYDSEDLGSRLSQKFKIDVDDIRSRIGDLARAKTNGRQIRNAVSTARQLAMFRGEAMGFRHLETAIKELEKFELYLQEVKGVSEDTHQRHRLVR